MKAARDVQPGDKLRWDATVVPASPAEVVNVKPVENGKVAITYITPEGELKTFCYDANEPLWVVE